MRRSGIISHLVGQLDDHPDHEQHCRHRVSQFSRRRVPGAIVLFHARWPWIASSIRHRAIYATFVRLAFAMRSISASVSLSTLVVSLERPVCRLSIWRLHRP
jgi:hypothetical protein